MIDTHTHLYAEEFDNDRIEVIERAINSGISDFYLPAIDSSTHSAMLDLETKYPNKIFAMMGLHPCSVKPETWEKELNIVQKHLGRDKIICYWQLHECITSKDYESDLII